MSPSETSVLLFAENKQRARQSAKKLIKAGIPAVTARDREHAISLLESRSFQWLALDFGANVTKCVDLIIWVKANVANMKVLIILEGSVDKNFKGKLVSMGADMVSEGEIPIEAIANTQKTEDYDESFSGRVEGVDILDYLQFIMLAGQTTIVEISSKSGARGRIYVRAGEVAHATCNTAEGEEALFRCLKMRGGRFSNAAWREPDKITINKPGDLLLFEAARIRDEERGLENVAGA